MISWTERYRIRFERRAKKFGGGTISQALQMVD
jgi:hypothetical protein